MRVDSLAKVDREHNIRGFSILGTTPRVIFQEARGIVLKDVQGKEYLDFASGVVNVNVGFGRRELGEVAMEQMTKLNYTPTLRGFTHTAVIECTKKLMGLVPEGLDHFFYCCGGSEAADSAIKMARFYWRTKGKNKYKIISPYNSYHGLTYGALSATTAGNGQLWRKYEPLLPGFVHIPNYNCYRCPFGLEYPACDTKCARFLTQAIKNEDENATAAFMAEPVQGVGGFVVPPPTYWPLVRKICTENNVLLIADEVMTGFGRTGKMFAVDNWDVKPDIMLMAKGITSGYLPFAAVAISKEIFKQSATPDVPFLHAYSYSGHPVCCAVATIIREKLAENAAKVGKHIVDRLHSEFANFSHVANINGIGLMCGFEIVANKATRAKFDTKKAVGAKLVERINDEGLLVRMSTPDWIGLAPPLTVTIEETDRAIDVLKPIVANVKESLD